MNLLEVERRDLIREGFYLADHSVHDRVLWGDKDSRGVSSLMIRFGSVAGDDEAPLSCLATIQNDGFALTSSGNYETLRHTFKRGTMLENARASGFLGVGGGELIYEDWAEVLRSVRGFESLIGAGPYYDSLSVVHGVTLKVGHNLFEVSFGCIVWIHAVPLTLSMIRKHRVRFLQSRGS